MPLRSWESTMRARVLLAAMGLLGVIGLAILAPEMENRHSARHLRPAPDCVDPRAAPWARCEVPGPAVAGPLSWVVLRGLAETGRGKRLDLGRPQFVQELIEGALARYLVGAPAQEAGPVAETVAGHLIVQHPPRPVRASAGTHSADRALLHRLGPPGALPVKPDPPRYGASFAVSSARAAASNPRNEADMVELPGIVIQPEQQRSDHVAVRCVPKAGDHAIGSAPLLDLQHRPHARLIGRVTPLGDHPVQRTARSERASPVRRLTRD